MRLRTLTTLIMTLPVMLCAQWDEPDDFLEVKDIPQIMQEIFSHHVAHRELTPELMGRALYVYVDHFDPMKSYLLHAEVEKYLNPSDELVGDTLRRYEDGEISTFFKINNVIQSSIHRARQIRAELKEEIDTLFVEAESYEPVKRKPGEEEPFAATEKELKQRIREELLAFIKFQTQQVGERAIQSKKEKVLDLFERNLKAEENKYLYVDKQGRVMSRDRQAHFLTLHTLQALAKSLDAHTSFFSYAEAYDMKIRLEKGFKGVGIVLQESIDGVTITRLIEGGPAERSEKIEEGDRIVAVDGETIVNYSFDDVLDIIRGEEGTSVVLGIRRLLDREREEEFEVTIVREQIEISEERVDSSWEPYGDGIIGKLTLHSFYDGENGISSVRDMRNAVRDLQKKGDLKGLVVDMRDNTGGFLMQAVKVAGLFISNGVVVVSKYGDGEVRYFRDIDGHSYYDGPLVILTSRGSASAAEIVAQALQDYGRALVVGDPTTYGKGSIQHQTVTDSNRSSYFKVTVGRYYTVSGDSTQIDGVHADITVPTAMHEEELGERYLDFPLDSDEIAPSYEDTLADLDFEARRWYERYYTPSLEQMESRWRTMLPVLRKNSAYRLANDDNFQEFLEELGLEEEEVEADEDLVLEEDKLAPQTDNYGVGDLQMTESVSIVKDMVLLEALH